LFAGGAILTIVNRATSKQGEALIHALAMNRATDQKTLVIQSSAGFSRTIPQ
jgi:hypothetical protein